jgi:hypothetical protein
MIRREAVRRAPDWVIGDVEDPYLLRWWVIPRNRWFNVYLHCFLRSDDDRALHDHPWASVSMLLRGRYIEETIRPGGVHAMRACRAGAVRVRGARFAHRIIVAPGDSCWTLFITGPNVREWGFHCANGWRHWKEFTDPANGGRTAGRGCE